MAHLASRRPALPRALEFVLLAIEDDTGKTGIGLALLQPGEDGRP